MGFRRGLFNFIFLASLLMIAPSIMAAEPVSTVSTEKKEKGKLAQLGEYLPTKHYAAATIAAILGGLGRAASAYCVCKKLTTPYTCQWKVSSLYNMKYVPSFLYAQAVSTKAGRLAAFSQGIDLVLPLTLLGWIVKNKRYAYAPACLSQMIIPALQLLYNQFTYKNRGLANKLTVGAWYYYEVNTEITLALLAAGYAYETYQEKKHKKAVSSDEFAENIAA